MMRLPIAGVVTVAISVVLLAGCQKPSLEDDGKPVSGRSGKESLAELQKLLDGIPKESQPRADKDGEIERNKANKWLEANVIGKKLSLSTKVGDVGIKADGDKYRVSLTMGRPVLLDGQNVWEFGHVGDVRVGGRDWPVVLDARDFAFGTGYRLVVDEAAAKRIRDLKGKVATIQGTVDAAAFSPEVPFNNTTVTGPYLSLRIRELSVDGVEAGKK
jgi:hypothetical protein